MCNMCVYVSTQILFFCIEQNNFFFESFMYNMCKMFVTWGDFLIFLREGKVYRCRDFFFLFIFMKKKLRQFFVCFKTLVITFFNNINKKVGFCFFKICVYKIVFSFVVTETQSVAAKNLTIEKAHFSSIQKLTEMQNYISPKNSLQFFTCSMFDFFFSLFADPVLIMHQFST